MQDTSDELPNLDPPEPRSFRRESVLVAKYVLVPLLVFAFVSNVLIGSGPIPRWMDRYRPPLEGWFRLSTLTHVEKQMLHLEMLEKRGHPGGVIPITGSSSVVNGIDSAVIDSVWRQAGQGPAPINYGMTMLGSYELPMLKRYLLTKDATAAVYLYNAFSFSDRYHPDAVGSRFDVAEFLRLFGPGVLVKEQFHKGVVGQAFFVVRYRNLIREMIKRGLAGKLEPMTYAFDLAPGQQLLGPERGRPCEPAVPDTEFTRVRYIESIRDSTGPGYQALERFLDLAAQRHVKVVLAPVPVPDWYACSRYRRGLDEAAVNRHVAQIASRHGATYIGPDSFVAAFQAHDPWFRDNVHTSEIGRNVYSAWLAHRLLDVLPERHR